jgi:hypothetical protein
MRTRSAAGLLALVAIVLSGCASTVTLEPAEDAADPACAEVIVALRNVPTVAGLEIRETDAQGTAAWGEPAAVLLTCGVPVPPPTSEVPCVTEPGSDVDWLRDDSDAPRFRFTTYGREPAIEVYVDNDAETGVSGTAALADLGNAVNLIEQTGRCLSLDDAENAG